MGSNNIILIGMPASGKSTVGVIVAKKLGYAFVDTDLIIQTRMKAKLEEIILSKGIETFLDIESDACCSLSVSKTVIATGGSVIYSKQAMEHLKKLGKVIYLKVDYSILKDRIPDMDKRGVVRLNKQQTLLSIYRQRTSLYEQYADIIIDEKDMDLEGTADAVVNCIAPVTERQFC